MNTRPSTSPFNEALWQETIRRRELRRYAFFLCELADKVQLTEDFTTDTPIKLAKLIEESSRLLAECIQLIPPNNLQEVDDFLGKIAAHLRYVERAKVTQTPWSIIQTAEEFLKKQAGANSNFIIRPTWSYNYSLIGEFCEFYQIVLKCWSWFPLDKLKNLVPFLSSETIYCISFPRTERQNCLLHTNWGHEVGHIIASRWMNAKFGNLWSSAEPDIRKRIEDEVRKNPPPVDPLFKEVAIHDVSSRKARTAMEAARTGLTELVCDIIGIHLFGPAALAAALEFAVRFELDASPLECDYYPPWRYRLRTMIDYCKDDLENHEGVGYPGDVITPFINWLREANNVVAIQNDVAVIKSKIETREAYDFIENNWKDIYVEVIESLPSDSSKPYRLYERPSIIESLVSRLQSMIPPNETEFLSNTPACLQDILTSAWVYKIQKIVQDNEWGTISDFSLLFRLVLKGCESSHIHSVWGKLLKEIES